MTNKKVTHRALLMSATSLLICISMLLGTTFAWFTDEVTSGVNQIVAGNLDVELYHSNAKVSDSQVTGATTDQLFFTDVDGNEIEWEPGAVSYEVFTIKNVGSLALKYQLSAILATTNSANLATGYNTVQGGTAEENGKSLIDVLRVIDLAGNQKPTSRTSYSASDGQLLSEYLAAENTNTAALEANSSVERTLIIYWPESSTDNTWNLKNGKYASDSPKATDSTSTDVGALKVFFAVKLLATQYTSESDSFDNQYDSSVNNGFETATISSTTAAVTSGSDTTLVVTDLATATVPAASTLSNASGTIDSSSLTSLTLEVEKQAATTSNDATIAIETVASNAGATVESYEVTLYATTTTTTGADTTTETTAVTGSSNRIIATLNIGTGKVVTAVYHKAAAMTDTASETGEYYSYDSTTGILTLYVNSFSPFAVAYTVPATGITISETATVTAGESTTLTATVSPSNSTDTVTWTTSDSTIATIADGIVTGVAAGEATITAKAGNVSATCTVTVSLPPVAIIGTVGYDSVQAAFNAAADGDTIVLCQDVALTEGVTFNKNVTATFDMNSKKLSNANANINNLLTISNGNLSLKNGSIVNENEGQTTSINAVYLCGDASAAEISNINIRATGNGIYLDGSSSIGTMNATIYTYADTDGYSMYDAINLGEGCTIHEITGGTYDALLTSAYLESGVHSWNACHVLRVNGTIDKISGGTFKGVNPGVSHLIAINGSIGEISGGYFGYEEYSKDNPTNLFSDAGKVNSISGGTFVSGFMINQTAGWDLLNGSNAQSFRDQLATGKTLLLKGTVEVKRYSSTSEITNTVNVYEVVDAE